MRLHELKTNITTLINSIERPETNDIELQNMLFGFAIFKTLEGLAKQHKRFEDEIKDDGKVKLTHPVDQFILNEIPEVKVFAKVSNPRKSFDKDAFIKAVADKFNLSAHELYSIAEDCEKIGAAPVSLTCEIKNVVSST